MGVATLTWNKSSIASTATREAKVEEPTPSSGTMLVSQAEERVQLIEIDPDQKWYWTDAWQMRAREAESDLQHGRYRDFATMDDFIRALDEPLEDE